MNIISNKDQVLELIRGINKPSMLRFDESYFNDINLIHCVIHFEALSIYKLNELMDINIDESLVKQSTKILLHIISSTDLKKIEMEAVAQIISEKTNSLEYHIQWEIDFDFDKDHFDLFLIFVE